MNHTEKPIRNTHHNPMAEAKLMEILTSDYYQYAHSLRERVVGKKVFSTLAGTSGFALFFSDGEWIITYLYDMKLCWEMGKGEVAKSLKAMMNSPEFGDGKSPLLVNLPYANEVCDIDKEITNALGKEITNIAIGSDSFNFCFPDGKELDTKIIPTADKKYALRVFWEQW